VSSTTRRASSTYAQPEIDVIVDVEPEIEAEVQAGSRTRQLSSLTSHCWGMSDDDDGDDDDDDDDVIVADALDRRRRRLRDLSSVDALLPYDVMLPADVIGAVVPAAGWPNDADVPAET